MRCDSQQEVDDYWSKLSSGGSEVQCGWLKDKFGLSWQIVPARLPELIRHPKAMQAMLQMKKLDIAEHRARGAIVIDNSSSATRRVAPINVFLTVQFFRVQNPQRQPLGQHFGFSLTCRPVGQPYSCLFAPLEPAGILARAESSARGFPTGRKIQRQISNISTAGGHLVRVCFSPGWIIARLLDEERCRRGIAQYAEASGVGCQGLGIRDGRRGACLLSAVKLSLQNNGRFQLSPMVPAHECAFQGPKPGTDT